MLVVQMVAPLLGNVIMSFGGWRGIQLASGGIAAALLLFVLLTQSETMPSAVRSTTRAFFLGYLKPSISLLQRPGFLPLVLQGGLLYSAYPAFVSIAPHLMVEALGRPETEFAYYFAFLPLGYFAGNAFVLKFGRRLGHDALVLTGAVVAIAACLISAALFFAGIAHPLSLFLPAGALLNVGLGLALPTVSARAITLSTPSIGSGWGLVGCAQQVFAALSVQTMGLFATNSPFPVLALSAGAMLLVCGLETWRRSQAADTSI
jgi:MFS transporter, DHA1 family, multidrug resistance protein